MKIPDEQIKNISPFIGHPIGKTKRLTFIICISLVLCTLAVYWQALNSDFVNFDDISYVIENAQVQAGLTRESVFWAFSEFHIGNWHPLSWLSHMLDIEIYGQNPSGHHLTSLLIHICNALLLFSVLLKMSGALWQSALVALLFAIHPLNVESVAWVSERKNVLSTFFWFLAMWAYVGYIVKKNISAYLFVILFLALGLMSKSMLVTFPFALILLDYWPLKRWGWNDSVNFTETKPHQNTTEGFGRIVFEKIPFFLLVLGSCIITYSAQQRGGAMIASESHTLLANISNAVISYVNYLQKLMWPQFLSVLYPHPGNAISIWKTTVCALILVGITILTIRLIRSAPYLAVGWFWYLGTLVPVIGIVQVGQQSMADRYMYIPLVGIFIVIAWGFPELIGKGKQKIFSFFMGSFICLCILFSWRQVSYWKNSISLYEHAISITKNKNASFALIHYNLGISLDDNKKYNESILNYKQAITLNPIYIDAYINLGNALALLAKPDEAIQQFRHALAINPQHWRANYNLGYFLNFQKQYSAAESYLREAIKLVPNKYEAQYNLGLALNKLEKYEEAIVHYRKAILLKPGSPTVANELGIILYKLKKYDESIRQFQQVIKIKNDFTEAYINLASALADNGMLQESIANYRRAIDLQGNNVDAHINLGITLNDLGRFEEAIAIYKDALEIDSSLYKVHSNLATLLMSQRKDVSGAITHFKKAISIEPEYAKAHNNLGAVLAQQGKYEESIIYFKKALAIDPNYIEAKKYLEFARAFLDKNKTK